MPSTQTWPNGARAAIALTFDNMGEAADLNRNLWPSDQPIGTHYSVTLILPTFLTLVRTHQFPITYFAEAWNLSVYPAAIRSIAAAGHEVGWHAWQHEMWSSQCADAGEERRNFERSWSAMRKFLEGEGEGGGGKLGMYKGFRPPGGIVHGERTLKMCREFGLGYISPAAEEGAVVPVGEGGDEMVVLPFRWRGVDAYYYMPAFGRLREMKGEASGEAIMTPEELVERFTAQIDEVIERGGFLSLLFHPFLTDSEERMRAMEAVVRYLAERREEGKVWVARCRDVEAWVREHPGVLGTDPRWDGSSWR